MERDMTEDAIKVQGLTVAYGKNVVIQSASFEISKHDFVCIVGANGSGKSTLVRALLGLIPINSGRIRFGKGIEKNTIGFLPQETRTEQDFPATVFEIVLSGTLGRLGMKAFYRKEDKERAKRALEELGIAKLKDESYTKLSGGQRQKVLLARALVATSELLILDEPSNNLDHKSRKEFYKTLARLNERGLTVLMITHDLDVEDLIGNKVLAIKNGEISCEYTDDYIRSFR